MRYGLILRKDFIHPGEISLCVDGIHYTEEKIQELIDSIPGEEILQWAKTNNCFIVAGPPREMSLLDLEKVYPNRKDHSCKKGFYRKDTVKPQWYVIRKNNMPRSTLKGWREQKELLPIFERVPNVAELVWCVKTYKVVRDIYLFGNTLSRTASQDPNGNRINVGEFNAEGFTMDISWNQSCYANLGITAIRM